MRAPATLLAAVLSATVPVAAAAGEGSAGGGIGADGIDFSAVDAPEPQRYETRNGEALRYRLYGADADGARATALVFVHGSTADSRHLARLGRRIAAETDLVVATPTLRGHGPDPRRRGDVAHAEQLLDDLEDLAGHLADRNGVSRVVLGGHSSGGGLALKHALERGGAGASRSPEVSGYLLVAPYIHHQAASARDDAGWARPRVPRLIALSLLDGIGVDWFQDTTVIAFDVPDSIRTDATTDGYSYRMNAALTPGGDYAEAAGAVSQPVSVVVGAEDGVFRPEGYDDDLAAVPALDVEVVDGSGHMDILMSDLGLARIVAHARRLAATEPGRE